MWDSASWLSLHRAFPALDGQTPNRVVITTRVEDVALVAGKDRAIRLEILTKEQARDLLFRKAFTDREIFNNRVQNPVLERILGKCQGLPLAIVAVGSILAQKDEEYWKSFSDNFTMHLNDPTMRGVVDVLNLSVTNLPSHLKNCFLHCSLFPESCCIIRNEITKMWVAEGFIREGETDITMEELADQYLLELVNHSLLQVAEERWDGQPKKLIMNNFMREVALTTSRKMKFGTILGDSYGDKLDYGTRRVSVQTCGRNPIPTKVSQKLRSFLLFPSFTPYTFTNDILSSCMLLRVLCLKYAKVKVLPDCVAKLFNLCYLNLRYSGIKQIPESFVDLHNLEVLDLRCEEPVSLSCGSVAKLHKLRHLLVREDNPTDLLSGVCALENLQTLKTVVFTEDSGLGNFRELRNLTLAAVAGSNDWDILDSLMQLSNLISLKIFNRCGACVKLTKCKAFPDLEKVHLVGPVDVTSSEIQSDNLQKLKVLKMENSGIQTDPLPHISLFPDIVVLCLQNAYQGPNLTFKENWLPKLKSLTLSGMDQVVSIYIEPGTMRTLNFLRICQLKKLKEAPKGILYLGSLHELCIEEMPQLYSMQLEGVRVLIEMVKVGSARQQEMATNILLKICEKNEAYKIILEQEGVIKPLVSLSESSAESKWRNFLTRHLAESKAVLGEAKKQQFEGSTEFSHAELATATMNFDESVKIGEGSGSSVYKGILRDTLVATKVLNHEGSKVREREFNQEVLERVKELLAQNKQDEAAELCKSSLNEKNEIENKLAESQSLLEIATTELKEMKIERDHAFQKNAELFESKEEGSSHGPEFTRFSLGELKKATKDFDNSLKIGEGASGRVYKGFLRHTYVTIKLLEGSKVQDQEFNQEMEVLSKVRHPNLVSLIGANLEVRALVHEYLSNGGLDSYLLNGKNNKILTWQHRLRIASEICSALIFLHSQGIAHGNLKPENVLLDSALTSKVSDFSLSRKLEHSNETMSPIYVTSRPKSSLAYIDPVYLAYGELTPQSDVFAFGIILLQFVTGRDPRGLRSDVEQAVDGKRLDKFVDSSAGKWPPKVALKLAELGIKCSDQRRRARPHLQDVYDKIKSIEHDALAGGHSKWFKQ